MNEFRKPTIVKDAQSIDMGLPLAPKVSPTAEGSRTQVDAFIARRAEVAKSDHEEFQEYLREKQARALAVRAEEARTQEKQPTKVTRRGMLRVAAGTAIVGESAALGYNAVQSGAMGALGIGSDHGLAQGGAVVAEAQRHPITRELIDSKGDVGGRSYPRSSAAVPMRSTSTPIGCSH